MAAVQPVGERLFGAAESILDRIGDDENLTVGGPWRIGQVSVRTVAPDGWRWARVSPKRNGEGELTSVELGWEAIKPTTKEVEWSIATTVDSNGAVGTTDMSEAAKAIGASALLPGLADDLAAAAGAEVSQEPFSTVFEVTLATK